jgi:hypothetical protein
MTSPTLEKTKKLVDALYRTTLDGNIEWKPGFDENSVETTLGKTIVQLTQEPDDDDSPVIAIRLKNNRGDELDLIYPGILYEQKTGVPQYQKYWQLFDGLYAMAKRSAMGADQALDEVIAELEKKDIPF